MAKKTRASYWEARNGREVRVRGHVEKGRGDGPAARFLYPKPRNFGAAQFRLISTANRMPSDDDLLAAVRRGMPGSAMVRVPGGQAAAKKSARAWR